MHELLRTNDLILISRVEAILSDEGIRYFVADQHMSAIEGSLGFLPRRILVHVDDLHDARHILWQEGLMGEIRS